MAKGIKLNLKGFEKMLADIQAAGKDVDAAAAQAINESARVVDSELRTEAAESNVPDDITQQITAQTTQSADRYSASVGWKLDTYNPQNPSAGYKAIFLNYGTVRRRTRRGYNRGAIAKRAVNQQFIYRAKQRAAPKVRKIQREILRKALGDLK